jgi:hypothetical protein
MNFLHIFPAFSGCCSGNLTDSRPVRPVKKPGNQHRLGAYAVVSMRAGVRTQEARALTWADVDLEATVAVYRSVRAKGDTKTARADACSNRPDSGPGSPGLRAARAPRACDSISSSTLARGSDKTMRPDPPGQRTDSIQCRNGMASDRDVTRVDA